VSNGPKAQGTLVDLLIPQPLSQLSIDYRRKLPDRKFPRNRFLGPSSVQGLGLEFTALIAMSNFEKTRCRALVTFGSTGTPKIEALGIHLVSPGSKNKSRPKLLLLKGG
jgi:hypothetical protein